MLNRFPVKTPLLYCNITDFYVSSDVSCGCVILAKNSMTKQVTEFLSRNNLLDPNQSGFKSGHSTETALLSVTEALKTARAAAQSSALVLLDLSAAFDTVNHRILLS